MSVWTPRLQWRVTPSQFFLRSCQCERFPIRCAAADFGGLAENRLVHQRLTITAVPAGRKGGSARRGGKPRADRLVVEREQGFLAPTNKRPAAKRGFAGHGKLRSNLPQDAATSRGAARRLASGAWEILLSWSFHWTILAGTRRGAVLGFTSSSHLPGRWGGEGFYARLPQRRGGVYTWDGGWFLGYK